ncbi:CBO0543 family protein [Bacillus sp. CGMCC 1.16541]|uniref:CBO0543 family protein n=1 Tax=Bacillus sp. CGMCC 1.16541 TaxID=2185143 RepID=UPI000D73C5C9|nr:CBO0543 family protein [Bacillus sp. CGMCC 1.16541]
MIIDRWILIVILLFSVVLLFLFVPRKKVRDAVIIAIFLQFITWPAGLLAVEMEWIHYPVQLFPKENQFNRSSFTFEFFLFPVVAILFSIYYPKQASWWRIMLYTIGFVGAFTLIEVIVEQTTNLVQYDEWKWYWTFISVTIALLLNHIYYRWFQHKFIDGDPV